MLPASLCLLRNVIFQHSKYKTGECQVWQEGGGTRGNTVTSLLNTKEYNYTWQNSLVDSYDAPLHRTSTARYKARDSGKGAQRSAGGVDNIAVHLVAINYSRFMGKIDGTCGAFLSVVTPGDCRREARLHLNRWHCERKERGEINVHCRLLKDAVWFITSLGKLGKQRRLTRWRRAHPAFTLFFTAFVPRKTLQDFLTHG